MWWVCREREVRAMTKWRRVRVRDRWVNIEGFRGVKPGQRNAMESPDIPKKREADVHE
jgi:hypothetical protein